MDEELREAAERARSMIRQMSNTMTRFGVTMREASLAMNQVGLRLVQEQRDLYRTEWWKRSEPPPEFLFNPSELEWWERGEEPPFWCAA